MSKDSSLLIEELEHLHKRDEWDNLIRNILRAESAVAGLVKEH